MSSVKVEKALSIATQLQVARAEVSRLEVEFSLLVSPRPTRRQVSEPATDGKNGGNGKPISNKIKILRAFKKAEGPTKLLGVRQKLKLSESCVFSNVQTLVREKKLVKKGHGLYEAT
jgi:hypothetical protein